VIICRCFMLIGLFISLGALPAFAKNDDDVVVLKNGDRLTGEIKGLQKGELKIKADSNESKASRPS